MKQMKLKEISEPRLFSDVFPHTIPPHIVFDGSMTEEVAGETYEIHPTDIKKRDIYITDTTFLMLLLPFFTRYLF